LARPTGDGSSKPYAANVNRIFIVTATQPQTSDALIDRYLVVAETTGIHPVIVINKIDLADEQTRPLFEARAAKYRAVGYTVLFASVKRRHGLDAIVEELKGHTSILVGQSGVGKSSLVKSLLPDRDIRIGALSQTQQGRHTTTTSVLYHLPFGGDLIDSPGVRDFAVWHIEPEDIVRGFVEFREYLGHCRFSDCSHTSEPGCALLEAVDTGRIHPARLASYHEMMRSIQEPRRV
jgi:ribosome biogenesis GTPase